MLRMACTVELDDDVAWDLSCKQIDIEDTESLKINKKFSGKLRSLNWIEPDQQI